MRERIGIACYVCAKNAGFASATRRHRQLIITQTEPSLIANSFKAMMEEIKTLARGADAQTIDAGLVTHRFLLGRGRERISIEDRVALDDAMSSRRTIGARQILIHRDRPVNVSTFLISGYICRYMDDRQGYRQLVGVHVPGDFVDLHAFPMKRLDHDVATLSPVEVGVFEHDRIAELVAVRPQLTRTLWYSTLLDAAMHREWIFRLGRLSALGRIAHFFCELDTRLAMVGLNDEHRFSLPLTQVDLAEATGLTGVHVNRTLRTLREDGLMTFRDGIVEIIDRARLVRLGEFESDYLYADPVNL